MVQHSPRSVQTCLPFDDPPDLRVQVLGSSSAGNCTLVCNGRDAVLIDCGFGPRYIARALKSAGLSLGSLTGVLITHVHGDHVRDETVAALARAGVPLLFPEQLRSPLLRLYPAVQVAAKHGLLRAFRKQELAAGTLGIRSFEVPHDSPGGCYGYSVFGSSTKVTVATDIGFPLQSIVDSFAGSDTIVIESNHDPVMLENSGRPAWLKRRIRERGHLSNDQCAELVTGIVRASHTVPRAIVLAHISQQCNTNPLALATTEQALARESMEGALVLETFKDRPAAPVG